MAITSEKLLNRPSTEIHRRYSGRLAMKESLQEKMISGGPNNIMVSKKELGVVKVKVIQIKDLISTTTLLKKAEEETKRKELEKKEYAERESKLEETKDGGQEKVKLPAAPNLSFLDRIKKFLFNVLLGYIVYRLIPHIPKLAGLAKMALGAIEVVTDISGKILNGFATFVDWGFKAIDGAKGFVKSVGGDKALELFDKFTSVFATFVNGALIVSMILLKSRGLWGKLTGETAKKGAGLLSKGLTKVSGGIIKGGLSRTATRLGIAVAGKAGGQAIKTLSKVLNKIPIVGGLIDFGINLLLGEPVGRAAAKAAGATAGGALGGIVAGAIGSVVPFAGTFVGGVIGSTLGSFLGDWAGGALYDAFAGAKKETETQQMAGGGLTRGGKYVGGPVKRGIKKPSVRREVKVEPTKLKPGADVGGEEKVTNVVSVDYSEDFYNKNSKIPFFGPMFSIVTKAYSGDKPNQVDYKNAGAALNSWINTTFSGETLRGGIAFAEGGEVNAEMLMRGDDLTDVIAKSLENNISKRIDSTLLDLQNQIKLGGLKGMKDAKEGESPEDSLTVDMDGAEITGGDADFWTLVAIASREDGDPQAWADVAQSIYNRLGSGAYSGKTIRDLILGQMQYEPTWKFPKPGRTGYPNAEWKVIKDAASAAAATGQSESAMKSVAAALLNPTLQKNARDFIQGRTDFRGYSVSGGVTRKTGDNYFGWYNNYKGTQVASVPNFGASASPGTGGMLGGGKFIQGNSGASAGVHFHIGPGSQVKGTILQRQYFADARATAKQAIDYFLSKGSTVYDGRRGRYYKSGNEVGAAQQAHTASGSAGGIDMQVDFEKPVAFPLKTAGMSYRGNGFGVSADIAGSNSFVAHARYDEKGRVAPQERMKLYAKGGLIRGFTKAMLGERGIEFVLDTDTTTALEQNFPGFLDALNKANYDGAINVLRNYASYESGYPIEIEIEQSDPEIVYVPMMSSSQSISVSRGGSSDSSYDSSYERG